MLEQKPASTELNINCRQTTDMRILIYATLLHLVLFLASCTPTATNNSPNYPATEPDGTRLFFQTISQRAMSGVTSPEEHVITDDKEWAGLWARIHSNEMPVPNMPQIRFDKESILGVFMGTKNTGGYGIEIKRVIDTGKKIIVLVEQISPPEGAMVTMAITQPYHVVKIENPEGKPIEFIASKQ